MKMSPLNFHELAADDRAAMVDISYFAKSNFPPLTRHRFGPPTVLQAFQFGVSEQAGRSPSTVFHTSYKCTPKYL
jgi:hypothetical protein